MFHFRHRPEKNEQGKTTSKCCVFIQIHAKFVADFIRLYNGKHWLDVNGEDFLFGKCRILKITSIKESSAFDSVYLNRKEINKLQKLLGVKVSTSGDKTKSSQLLEFNPPPDMPFGNVGTPTSFFINLINECRLSSKVIQKLGLYFPSARRRGKYSAVSFIYSDSETECSGENVSGSGQVDDDFMPDEIAAGNGLKLLDDQEYLMHQQIKKENERRQEDDHRTEKTIDQPRSQISDQLDEDDDDTEEWDRFEALHDDPHNINRGKCRRFEEEQEVVWEKGGSGLVFYTDEQVWRAESQLEIFDEPTNYDWDIDTSVWYEKCGGDKDSKDIATIRRESRWEAGKDDGMNSEEFFNIHKECVGRQLMEQSGWRVGDRLGHAERKGLEYALDNDGQKPNDKTGLGYYGRKLIRQPIDDDKHTVKRKLQQPVESLYRRNDPGDILKYRVIDFVRGEKS